MGSFIEINDTLRISKQQGFPAELRVDTHLKHPFLIKDFGRNTYNFTSKSKICVYKIPPVRNFLVEDIGGKWLYWGLCHIIKIEHDYIAQETSGQFKITHLNSPKEMEQAFNLVDRVWGNNYFNE